MASTALSEREQIALGQWACACADDPLRFVQEGYPWGEPGSLLAYDGPDAWQRAFLVELGQQVRARRFDGLHPVAPIRMATSSGHGIGKSVLVAWLVDWLMSTRDRAKGTITANTNTQLETKTWAAVQRWTKLCVTAPWFEVNTQRLYKPEFGNDWACTPQTCREENSEAFAGQHEATSTSFYIFDEASAVPDVIYEVAEGGLTDGEPMIFIFGNPTRRHGRFYDACFGAQRGRWTTRVIDSRTAKFTNKTLIGEWEEDYGEDSDFFRVRVRGLPPNAAEGQFIDARRVQDAQRREVLILPDEPLVAGCDLAWGGTNWNVIRFRRGLDARSIPAIRIPGELSRDPLVLTSKLANVLTQTFDGVPVQMLFLDSAGIAGPIGQRLRSLGHQNVIEVNFGADSPSDKCVSMRDYMWAQMKDWLLTGAIDRSSRLEGDLTAPGLREDRKQRLHLESKKELQARGVESPDEGDALALTFAHPVRPVNRAGSPRGGWLAAGRSWQG